MKLKLSAVLACLVALATPAFAQTPDRRGEVVVDSATYRNTNANAPIPPDLHVRNEGGSDGAGLCVISSVLANGMYQGVPGLDATGADENGRAMPGKGSALWRLAKKAPGGYGPDKLAALIAQAVPGEHYASSVTTDPSILDQWSAAGYPIGATMNTGALYGYKPIHHMISLIHYKTGGWASVVDNNDPGKYHWMPASEYHRRWIDQGTGWAWIWTRRRVKGPAVGALILLAGLGITLYVILAPPPTGRLIGP